MYYAGALEKTAACAGTAPAALTMIVSTIGMT